MGKQARMRALSHVYTVKNRGGTCDCSRCRHPPRLRPGDTIDFDAIRGIDGQAEAEAVALAMARADGRRIVRFAVLLVAALVALAVGVWGFLS